MKHCSKFYFKGLIALIVLLVGLTKTAFAELVVEPAEPTVMLGCSLKLSVFNASTDIIWFADIGEIDGEGTTIIYIPKELGTDIVMVSDSDVDNPPKIFRLHVLPKTQACPTSENSPSATASVILIHSSYQGNDGSIQIEEHIASMKLNLHNTLKARFYEEDEIYITPLDVTLEKAFEEAKNKSQIAQANHLSEEPLVVIFIGKGLPDNLVLSSPEDLLSEQHLNSLLEDYQKATGNEVVVMLDAPYSGTLIDALKGENRLIITSTNDTEHNTSGINSFIVAYFSQLYSGKSYGSAFEFVTHNLPEFNQEAQLAESSDLAQTLCLNDCFYGLPGPVITIQGFGNGDIIPDGPPVITPYQRVKFETHLANDAVVIDAIVEHPHLSKLTIPLEKKANSQWDYTYAFTISGYYTIHFKIQNNNLSVVETKPVTLAVIERTTLIDNILHLPVAVPTGEEGKDIVYHVQLIQKGGSNRFELDSSRLNIINNTFSVEIVPYDPITGRLSIPRLDLPDDSKSAQLQLIYASPTLLFELTF